MIFNAFVDTAVVTIQRGFTGESLTANRAHLFVEIRPTEMLALLVPMQESLIDKSFPAIGAFLPWG